MAAEPHAADAGAHYGEVVPFPPFDASLFSSQLIWFALTFGALYLIVSRFIVPRVGAVQARRAGAISSDLDQAAQKSAAADEARAAMEKARAKARAEARAMVEAARADMTAKLGAEQEAAEARLAKRISEAEAKVAAAREQALGEIPALANDLAREITDKIAPASGERRRAAGEA